MHTLRYLLLILFAWGISTSSFAQQSATGSIAGKVTDAANAPVSYATITLLRTDSSVAGGDLSKDDGSFRIAPVGAGSFMLRVESMGYTTKFMNVAITEADANKKVGNIKLQQAATALKTATITGEKPLMEMKVDKKVFNVEKNITTAGGSAADVLQNVPAVSVDQDGTVNLRGKSNVTILIDGKPATLLGSDVTSALQSLPAGSIESVEVITNPSAKYDAQGTTGIINIITKKDGRFGMNGSVTLGAGTRDKYNGNLSLNIRKGKWNVFLNSSARVNNTYNNVTTNRQNKGNDTSYHTYEHVPRQFNGAFNTIGATYDIDKNNSITFTQNINKMGFGYKDWSDYYIYSQPNEQGTPVQQISKYSDAMGGPLSFSSALDYKHKFKKKDEELSVDATYSFNHMKRSQNYFTAQVLPAPSPSINSEAPGEGGNSSVNIWADYTDPLFTKNGKLGLGFKSQFYTFNSKNDPWFVDEHDVHIAPDNALYTKYDYDQQIHAAYVNWSDQLGKFSYQVGLRGEYAEYNGTGGVPQPDTFSNSFTNLFPSAFISYQLPAQQSVYLNYSKRTNRPNFFQMMPFKDLSNPGTVSMGNPDLVPEFIDNIELSYSKADNKGNNFILSTYYAYTANFTERVLRPITGSADDIRKGLSDQVGNLLSEPVNIASGTTYGVEGTGHFQFSKIWDATLNLNYFQNQLNIGQVPPEYQPYLSNMNGNSWFGKLNTNLKLPGNISIQLTGNYESPKIITQGELKESYWIDLAVRKNLWKNKATLVLNCSDIFKTRQFITYYDAPGYTQTIDRVKETRIGNITFTYRFGKSDAGKNIAGGKKNKGGDLKPNTEDRVNNLKQGDDDNGGGGGNGGGQKPQGGR